MEGISSNGLPVISSKYGNLKDYIGSQKLKKSSGGDTERADFNNKRLANYLDEMEGEEEQLHSKDTQIRKDIDAAILKSCYLLESGFNVCLHGFGSKRTILTEISSYYTETVRIIISGYFPSSSMFQIAAKLRYAVSKLLGLQVSGSKRTDGIIEYLQTKQTSMKNASKYILLVFHNIDGKQFQEPDTLLQLSSILSLSFVKCVCSVEQVKWMMCLPPKVLSSFNLGFVECHSYLRYIKEFKIEQNTIVAKKETEGEALKYIVRSLTKIQREIMSLVAGRQLNGETQGVTLKDLLELCIDEMILSSDQQLKENLLEILDHKVFVEKKMPNNSKVHYVMPFNNAILQKVVDNKLEDEEEDDDDDDDGDEELGNKQSNDESQDDDEDNLGSNSSEGEENIKKKKKNNKRNNKVNRNSRKSSSSCSSSSRSNSSNSSNSDQEIVEKKTQKKKKNEVVIKKNRRRKVKATTQTAEEDASDDNEEEQE